MATHPASQGPSPAPTATPSTSASETERAALFDSGIWYLLSLWPALHVACANGWGGPDTLDKKDWFAGAVSELFDSRPDTDAADLEEVLLQIMLDEFETNVDDESEAEVALQILKLRERLVIEGDVLAFREVEQRWRNRGAMKMDVRVVETLQDVDGDAEGEEWVDGDGDLEMDDAVPALVPARAPREKPVPEVDEDGFTKVPSRKKR